MRLSRSYRILSTERGTSAVNDTDGTAKVISFGIPSLDEQVGRFVGGRVYVIKGTTEHAKRSLVTALARSAAKAGFQPSRVVSSLPTPPPSWHRPRCLARWPS